MDATMHRFRQAFFEEALEHLDGLEKGLLQLEASPEGQSLLQDIFRAAHSLKGGSATFGLSRVAELTHSMENLLGRFREGLMAVTPQLVDMLLRATDTLRGLLAAERDGTPAPDELERIKAELDRALGLDCRVDPGASGMPPEHRAELGTYRIYFAPNEGVFRRGLDPLLLLRDLARLGRVVRSEVDLERLPPLWDLDPECCYLAWSMVIETDRAPAEIEDVFAFVMGDSQIEIEPLPADHGPLAALGSGVESGTRQRFGFSDSSWLLALTERLRAAYEDFERALV